MNLNLFFKKIKYTDECWLWQASKYHNGYGKFSFKENNKVFTVRAHRVIYELFYNKIPEGLNVLHKCDVRNCVNPAHLYLGTQKENITDMFNKRRQGNHAGENHGLHKLTEKEILEIRSDNRLQYVIAKDYGISLGYVSIIKSGKAWRHI